jgi:type IV pilus assembly protein PilA
MQTPYPPGPPPQAKKSGFPIWLIIVLVTVLPLISIVGILAVLGIYGTRKYISNAKTVEARNALGQIAKDTVTAYEAAQPHQLCPSASQPVPNSLTKVKGVKYLSSPADWEVDKSANGGFFCLKFSMDQPQYFQYSYTSAVTTFNATAMGDLDGDGIPATLQAMGKVNSAGVLEVAPALLETNVGE